MPRLVPTRRERILCVLRRGPAMPDQLANLLGCSKSRISQEVGLLRLTGHVITHATATDPYLLKPLPAEGVL